MTQGIEEIAASIRGRLERLRAGESGIPVGAQMHDHAAYLIQVPVLRFYTEPRLYVETMLRAVDHYQLDVPMCLSDVYNIEAEALGQRMVYRDHCMPEIDYTEPLVKKPQDLNRLKSPDPYRDGRMPQVLEINHYFQEVTGLWPALAFCAPFSLAVGVRGYYNLVRDMRKEPSFAHALLEFLTMEVLVPWLKVLAQESPGGASPYSPHAFLPVNGPVTRERISAFGADAWASVPVVDLHILREFVLPYVLKLQEALGEIDVAGWWGESHLPGSGPEEMLEMKVQCLGGKALLILDPDVHKLGPARFRAFSAPRGAALILGLDATLLRDGPAEAIAERVRRYIKEGFSEAGLFLFLNNLPADTPSAHVRTAVSATKQLSRALVAGEDLDSVPLELT
ncbi:MAG: hypothetical protein HYY20_04495 [Candidatus Tectomicrobia bacterium]|uniref:Uroporphyrinogen decarboxylase (URO-D) domain-containing protein n=1 Tax=Tectimicrobiota bacterium TaxID=2528274 RepID=A0A932FUY4_UNCTE|nr:hypothetical protein [Candidatus Tectomicrobia bacterium]